MACGSDQDHLPRGGHAGAAGSAVILDTGGADTSGGADTGDQASGGVDTGGSEHDTGGEVNTGGAQANAGTHTGGGATTGEAGESTAAGPGSAGDSGIDGSDTVVTHVEIAENELAVSPGGTLTLTAHAFNAKGNEVTATITWQSADATIATIDHGVVTGVALGQTEVTATAGVVTSEPVPVWVNPTGTSAEALSRAVAAGEITADEALVYRIYYVFRDSRFPAKYRGTASDAGTDDLLMLEAARRFDSLTEEQQAGISPYFYPPPYRQASRLCCSGAFPHRRSTSAPHVRQV